MGKAERPTVKVEILELATGSRRHLVDNFWVSWDEDDHFSPDDWDGIELFWWLDGNGGCDCNRKIQFYRPRELPDDQTPCSHGEYLLRITNIDGKLLWQDENFKEETNGNPTDQS